MNKTKRALQVISGIFTLIFGIIVLYTLIVDMLPILKLSEIGGWPEYILRTILEICVYTRIDSLVCFIVFFALPIVFAFTATVLYLSQSSEKQAKYIVAFVFSTLSCVIFGSVAVLTMLDEETPLATSIIFVCAPVVTFVLTLIERLIKSNKALSLSEMQQRGYVVYEDDEYCKNNKDTDPVQNEEQNNSAKDIPYIPQETESVQEVMDSTYGEKEKELSSETLNKLNKVRALYENGVLTTEEYIKLVKTYLEEK